MPNDVDSYPPSIDLPFIIQFLGRFRNFTMQQASPVCQKNSLDHLLNGTSKHLHRRVCRSFVAIGQLAPLSMMYFWLSVHDTVLDFGKVLRFQHFMTQEYYSSTSVTDEAIVISDDDMHD